MGFACGIVGLPNVGKSTLFNALTSSAQAQAANYPFCTIEPNVGRAPVPDPRLIRIAEIVKPASTVPTQLDFVDIAGLVSGASLGEGLGNKFLGHVREVDAIAHVLRCFDDPDVTHVGGAIDPIADAETVETELMLADLDSLEKRRDPLIKKARGGDEDAKALLPLVERALVALQAGRPARTISVNDDEQRLFHQLHLLTAKPVLYICNVDEGSAASGNTYSQAMEERAKAEGAACVVVSAAIESEIAQLTDAEESAAFLDSLDLTETGLARVLRAGYALLDLITYFTAGPKEVRAWTIVAGTRAPGAAGRIHSDFERGFICAETIAYDDFIACGGEQGAKDMGKMRTEGRDYVVKDGDLLLFRFNV